MTLFTIIFGSLFINNIVLSQFLGICPFLGLSKDTKSAVGMGLSVMFVMVLSSTITWFIYYLVMVPLQIEYLKTIIFILTIAALVQFLEMFLKKYIPALHKSMGLYLPLITTNCTILGIALTNIENAYAFNAFGCLCMICNAIANSGGFLLALVLMSGIRERLEDCDIPEAMKGLPIVFFVAASMALAFIGFTGMI